MKNRDSYRVLSTVTLAVVLLRAVTFPPQANLILPALLSGMVGIMLYKLARVVFASTDVAIVAAALFAISPWAIAVSMRSTTAIAYLLFAILTVWLFVTHRRRLTLLAGVVGVVLLGVLLVEQQSIQQILTEQAKTIHRQVVAEGEGRNLLLVRVFHNKAYESVRFGLERLSSYIEPMPLLFTGGYFPGASIVASGFVLTIAAPFLLYGVYLYIKQRRYTWILLWLGVSILPGLASVHPGHAILASMLLLPLSLITGYAVVRFIAKSRTRAALVFGLIAINFLFVLSLYLPFV